MPAPYFLVIDGSASARYRLRLTLAGQGAEVVTVESVELALPMIQVRRPDAVFVNRILPGMNGLELLDLLRSDPATSRIPTVITGAGAGWPLRDLALRRGAAGLVENGSEADLVPRLLARIGREPAPIPGPVPVDAPTLGARMPPLTPRDPQKARHIALGLAFAGTGMLLGLLFLAP